MISLFFRNLFFTVLQPGIVAGLMPWIILNYSEQVNFQSAFSILQYAGIIFFAIGVVVMLMCIARFAFEGRGTLSPLDPTKKLVISGLYKYSRNPMYVGVMMILAGETLFFQSVNLLVYSLLIFCAFHTFIIFREEPRLRKDFEDDYKIYTKKVRRWI